MVWRLFANDRRRSTRFAEAGRRLCEAQSGLKGRKHVGVRRNAARGSGNPGKRAEGDGCATRLRFADGIDWRFAVLAFGRTVAWNARFLRHGGTDHGMADPGKRFFGHTLNGGLARCVPCEPLRTRALKRWT